MCVNCNDSLQVNLPIGPAGANGTNGVNAYLYTASANDNAGAGYTFPASPSQNFIGLVNTSTPFANPPTLAQFTSNPGFIGWHNWQGPQGIQGIQGIQGQLGPFGGVTFEYNFLGFNQAAGNPGTSNLGIAGASALLATSIYISHSSVAGGSIQNYFSFLSSITSSTKAAIKIYKKTDSTSFYIFRITSVTVLFGYTTLTLSINPFLGSGVNAPIAGDDILVSFTEVGDKGDAGNYVTTATEAPGVNCALGGLRVDLKNGVTNAIISTDYICKQDNIAAGIVNWFAGATAPSGYLVANGQAVLRATYPNLFAAIGTTYGFTNANDFLVPDLRGLFIRGSGSNVYDPDAPRTVGDLQGGTLESHTHNLLTQSGESYTGTPVSGVNGSGLSNGNTITVTRTTTVPNAPAQLSSETRPVNMALLPCIKY